MNNDSILARIEQGIAAQDDLFNTLIEPAYELCKPHLRELDGKLFRGCSSLTAKIGKLALLVEEDFITEQEALDLATIGNTCDICPLWVISDT